jgi:polar amino acid transport system substrate-binding protein
MECEMSVVLKLAALLLLFISDVRPISALELERKTVQICGDVAEWPPFFYFKRVDGEATTEVVGFTVDVLDEILGKHGVAFEIKMLPWKRCLFEVERGEKYQVALDATYSEERGQKYHFSESHYATVPYYFYS